jgi:hypothetical protein
MLILEYNGKIYLSSEVLKDWTLLFVLLTPLLK